MTEVVSFAQHDGVATLTMDDGKANAPSLAMSPFLDAIVDAGAFDATIAQHARELLELDPATFAATKQRLRQPTLIRIAVATS